MELIRQEAQSNFGDFECYFGAKARARSAMRGKSGGTGRGRGKGTGRGGRIRPVNLKGKFVRTDQGLQKSPSKSVVKKRKGSNTRQKVCRDAFDIRIRRELLQEYSNRPGNVMENLNIGSASAQLGSKELETLKARKLTLMKKLYSENAQFRDSFIKMLTAKQKYEASHQRTFGSTSKFAKN